MEKGKWPLHPQPSIDQNLYSWIITLSKVYEVGFEYFCIHALLLTPKEIYNLREPFPLRAFEILAEGTRVDIAELKLRDFNRCFQFWCYRLIELCPNGGDYCFAGPSYYNSTSIKLRELPLQEYTLVLERARSVAYAGKLGISRYSRAETDCASRLLCGEQSPFQGW